MATTLEVDFYSGGSFIYALQVWNKKGAPAIPCEIVRIGAYELVMGLAPKPIGWAASRDYGR